MTTAEEYARMAVHYSKAAEETNITSSRDQLQEMARTYTILAQSTRALQKSEGLLRKLGLADRR